VPAMLRAHRHNRRGFAVLPGGCLPCLPLLRQEAKHGQPRTSEGFSRCPPKVIKLEGWGRHQDGDRDRDGSTVAQSSGHRRSAAASHRAVATQTEPQLIYKGL